MTTSWEHINWPHTIMLIASIAVVLWALVAWLRNLRPSQHVKLTTYLHDNMQELVGIPAAFVLFWLSAWLLRFVDPTAAPFDSGALHTVTLAIVIIIVGHSIARFGARLNAASFDNDNTPINRSWLYVIYLVVFCLVAAIL